MKPFHPLAWLAWMGASMVVAATTTNPVASLVVLAGCGAVAVTFARSGTTRMLRAVAIGGGVVLVVRVVLFTLTGRAGATVLVQLPELDLPGFLGGFSLGGALSAEVLAQEVADGFRIFTILAVAAVFAAVTDASWLLRRFPRRLRHVGLLLAIALAFIPSLAAAAREVRDAQRMRGYEARRLRGLGPLLIPVLASAIDRAATLAETMQARGFSRPGASRQPGTPMRGHDRALIGTSMFALLMSLATAGVRTWSPYPVLAAPPLDGWLFVGAFVSVPIVLAALQLTRPPERVVKVPG